MNIYYPSRSHVTIAILFPSVSMNLFIHRLVLLHLICVCLFLANPNKSLSFNMYLNGFSLQYVLS